MTFLCSSMEYVLSFFNCILKALKPVYVIGGRKLMPYVLQCVSFRLNKSLKTLMDYPENAVAQS